MPVDVRTAPRRTIRFASPREILADLEAIAQWHRDGSLHASGNWDAGAIFRHLALPIERSMDGFEVITVPFLRRLLGRTLLRPMVLRLPEFKPGIKLDRRTEAAIFQPTDFDKGFSHLTSQLHRWIGGTPMTHPHPMFGPMNTEQWSFFHLRHAALHLSFLQPRT